MDARLNALKRNPWTRSAGSMQTRLVAASMASFAWSAPVLHHISLNGEEPGWRKNGTDSIQPKT